MAYAIGFEIHDGKYRVVWFPLFELDDEHVHLRDDYRANDNGIGAENDLVENDYESHPSKPNYHKSSGYLRAPEVFEHIRDFLYGARSKRYPLTSLA